MTAVSLSDKANDVPHMLYSHRKLFEGQNSTLCQVLIKVSCYTYVGIISFHDILTMNLVALDSFFTVLE